MEITSIYTFVASLLLLAATLEAGRRALMHQMRTQHLPGPSLPAPIRTNTDSPLAPAELAYLLRNGDMSHTLIVMSVDMIQRVVKSQTSGSLPHLRKYEKQVWLSVKDFLKQFAEQKAGHLLPLNNIKSPLEWALRFAALRQFVGQNLQILIKDIAKDPRNIRRYFSIAGVARLAVQLYTSGIRTSVEEQLRADLLQAGLLVPENSRRKYASLLMLIIPATVGGVLLVNMAIPLTTVSTLLSLLLMGVINAAVLHVIKSLPGFVPTYEEFARVSREIQRESKRLTMIRGVLKFGKGLVLIAACLFMAFLLGIDTALSALLLQLPLQTALPLLIVFTVIGGVIVRCLSDWHSLGFNEQPTLLAEELMKKTRSELDRQSPLQSLVDLTTAPDYNPQFSNLVAIYGIETLWLLS